MTNRIRDASWIEPIGYGSRHGPYARGEPLIRGKPTMGVGVSNSNITDLESPPPDTVISSEVEGSLSNEVALNNMRFRIKFGMTARGKPGSWLQWESRVLAAKKTDFEVGVFIPNRECYAWEEMRELEELHECRNGRKGEENVEYRMMNNEYRNRKPLLTFRQLTERDKKREEKSRGFHSLALKGRLAIAQGTVSDHWRNALCQEINTTLVAPRLNIVQGSAVAWGNNSNTRLAVRNRLTHNMQPSEMTKKENVEYRMMNNEYRNKKPLLTFRQLTERDKKRQEKSRGFHSLALKGRLAIAQGDALCNDAPTTLVAPRLKIVQGGNFAWGKINDDCSKIKNRSLSSLHRKNRSLNNTLFGLLTLIAPTAQSSLSTRREGEEGESSISLQYRKNDSFDFKNEKNPEEKRGQKNNTINKVSITGMRFRVEPGMTKIDNIEYSIKNKECKSIEKLAVAVAVCRKKREQSQFAILMTNDN